MNHRTCYVAIQTFSLQGHAVVNPHQILQDVYTRFVVNIATYNFWKHHINFKLEYIYNVYITLQIDQTL